jgi:molybdate transport system ATP-binding protein
VERLADTLVLLDQGRVRAAGPLDALQSDPALPIARLPDAGVTLRAHVIGTDPAYGLGTLAVEGGALLVPGQLGPPGTLHRIRIAASDVSLTREPPRASTILNVLPSKMVAAKAQDAFIIIVVVALGPGGTGARVLARISRRSWEALGLAIGQSIFIQIKGMALVAGDRAAHER